MALQYDLLRFIPVTVFLCALQICAMMTVEILEYPVLILQSPKMCSFWRLWCAILYRGKISTLGSRWCLNAGCPRSSRDGAM